MKKFDNFCSAFHNLKDIYDYEEPYSNVEMTGLVGLYEICFEQSWKAMKELFRKRWFCRRADRFAAPDYKNGVSGWDDFR